MQVAVRQDSADFDDLLSFVGDFGIGDGTDLMKTEAASPNDLSDSAWLDDLDKLFRDTSPTFKPPPIPATDEAGKRHSGDSEEELTLPVTIPVEKATKKSPGRPRVSRREELEYLRLKVREMQSKLQELKENSDTDRSPPPLVEHSLPDDQQNSMQVEHSIALWKTMAERQKTQRDLVEVENAKLREKLKTQVRMAKSLKRILRKRTRDDDQMSSTVPKRTRPVQHGANSSATLFDEMLQGLDELYADTDKHITYSLVASVTKPVIRKRDVKYNDANGMFLEFQDSKVLPFNLQTVSRATWRFLTEAGHKFNKYIEEHVEMRENTMLRKFGVEIKHGNSAAVLFGRQVFRRYVESHRVVLVRHTTVDEIQLSGAPTGGLTFRESGWIVLSDFPGILGTGEATLTRSYSTISPDIDLNAHWEVGTLTDFVLQSREDVEAGNDAIIENLLLEESAK